MTAPHSHHTPGQLADLRAGAWEYNQEHREIPLVGHTPYEAACDQPGYRRALTHPTDESYRAFTEEMVRLCAPRPSGVRRLAARLARRVVTRKPADG